MPFEGRLFGTYFIFFIGAQVVYYGMRVNGGAHPRNPVWGLVWWFHGLITYSTLAVIGVAFVWFVVVPIIAYFIPAKKQKELKPLESPTFVSTATPEELEAQKRKEEQVAQKSHEYFEAEQRRIEEQRKLEEEKKLKIVKARRERSATDAAHAGLDDFL